jgi:outer membrane receptor for ferrienterochelin and colicins
MGTHSRMALLTGTAFLVALPHAAHAQETPAPVPTPAPAAAAPTTTDPNVTPPAGGRRTYTPADFARYAPRTAVDMLQRVPGFVIREQESERGLGQATGNVLLNGQRISGKSDDVLTQLGRIPAGNVVRIEIVDGATLDIPGLSGQVANIIVRAGGISGQYSWNPEFRTNFTDPLLTRFSVSASGRTGPVEYTLAIENQSSHSGAGGPTYIFNPNLTLRETYQDIWTQNFEQPKGSARFVFHGPGSAIGNLNLLYREYWLDYRENGIRTPVIGLPRNRSVLEEQDGHNYEISGDYEFPLAGGRLKLIGNQSYDHSLDTTTLRTRFSDGSPDSGDIFVRDAGSLERIGRAEYRFHGLGGDWQISGEAAFNALETSSQLLTLDGTGTFVNVPFPGSAARVEEARYEGIASYSRRLSPHLTAQLGAGAEQSQLSQIGAGGLTREFVRPKGQLTMAWTPDPRTTLNLRLQRRVGQINFSDFVDSVNLIDNNQNAGNPLLVPPQSWEAEVEGVRRFGPWGSTTIRAYYHRVEDIIDIIPIGVDGQGIGNIDTARRWGIEARSTINFDPMGWRGARLDLRAWFQHTEVEDPLTHLLRPISGELHRFLQAVFRYDIPGGDWAVGSSASYEDDAFSYRLTEFSQSTEGPVFANVYVENKNVFGLTVRATAGNIFDARSPRTRTVFQGFRTGPVDFIEQRDRLIGPIFSFQVRGRF